MRTPTASLMTISTWPAAASEPRFGAGSPTHLAGHFDPQDVVAQLLDLGVIPLAVRFAIVGEGVHFRPVVRIRLGAVQQIDECFTAQLSPGLQPQQVFLLVDQYFVCMMPGRTPAYAHPPRPAGDPSTNGRHFVTQYAAPAGPGPYLGRV